MQPNDSSPSPAKTADINSDQQMPQVGQLESGQPSHSESGASENEKLDLLLARLSPATGENADVDGGDHADQTETLASSEPVANQQSEPAIPEAAEASPADQAESGETKLNALFASLRSRDEEAAAASDSDSECEVTPQSPKQTERILDSESVVSESLETIQAVDSLSNTLREIETGSEQPANEESEPSMTSVKAIEPTNAPPQPAPAEPAEPKQNESVAEILARMNCLPDLGEDEAESPAAQASVAAPVSTPEPAATQAATDEQADEDGADVQNYMNSLLQRLNGGSAPAAAPASSKAAQTESLKPAPEAANSKTKPTPKPQVTTPLNPDEFIPKRVAPERVSNLAAMRELANATSRNAVKSSELRRKQARANAQLLIAGVGVVCAAIMAVLSRGTGDVFFYLGVGCVLLTTVCGFGYLRYWLSSKKLDADNGSSRKENVANK